MPNDNDPCPCGSGKPFGDCCGAILAGRRPAADAEELMRARFTAHAIHDFEFVHRSYEGTAEAPYVATDEVPAIKWTRLVVHGHHPAIGPDIAHVDFSAYGTERGVEFVHHELAEFRRRPNGWIFTRPLREGPAPVKAQPKVGRNDPCPCGSGKKYKHCHGR